MSELNTKWKRLRTIVAGLLALVVVLGAWAFWIEPSRLVVKHVALAWPDTRARGLRIALLSDLHIGSPCNGLAKLRRVVEAVNRESPDVVLIAGDFVITGVLGGRYVEPEPIARELKALRARLGVIAVLGNHDMAHNPNRIARVLQAAGIRVLHNDALRIENGADSFWVAGLGDFWLGRPDVDGTLAGVTDGAPVFVLTHNPDLFPQIPARVSLTLAGHTHGGQVSFPFLGAPIVPSQYGQRYASGYVEENGKRLYVTTGIGTSILPVRFGVPPEVVILTLGNHP